jgi:hypothetical protein
MRVARPRWLRLFDSASGFASYCPDGVRTPCQASRTW